MDRFKEQLDQLSELSDEQVAELKSQIVSEFETVESGELTAQAVENMTTLADMFDVVNAEIAQREAAAQELASQAANAAARIKGEAGMDEVDEVVDGEEPAEGEEPVADEEDEDEGKPFEAAVEESTESELSSETEIETESVELSDATDEAAELSEEAVEAAVETPVEAEAAVEETEAATEVQPEAEASTLTTDTTEAQIAQEEQEAPVTAAANESESLEIQAPADRLPNVKVVEVPVAITAGADIPGVTAGSPMSSMSEVSEAFAKRLHALRRVNGGDGEQHIVASVTTSYPEDRVLGSDPEENWAKIQKVAGPEALVAAGGHQAPLVSKYDIYGLGVADRPVRDALPRFQADRGGIRYIVPPVLSAYANAVGVWTAANDITPTTPTTKASLTVTAASETTKSTDAITLQMQFGNLVTRAYPELIARHNELGLIQHARLAEQTILAAIDAGSTAVTSTNVIGFARDFLVQVGRAASAYRSRHRMDPNDSALRVIVPSWVVDAMQADLALQMPGDNALAVAKNEIEGYLKARGVNLTATPDQNVFGAQSSGAMNEFPDTFVWRLYSEGTFLFLDGGTLDLGIIRDSTLVGTNDYKMFVETFEGVAKVGIESISVTSTINVNGAAAALRDTLGGVAASTVEF